MDGETYYLIMDSNGRAIYNSDEPPEIDKLGLNWKQEYRETRISEKNLGTEITSWT